MLNKKLYYCCNCNSKNIRIRTILVPACAGLLSCTSRLADTTYTGTILHNVPFGVVDPERQFSVKSYSCDTLATYTYFKKLRNLLMTHTCVRSTPVIALAGGGGAGVAPSCLWKRTQIPVTDSCLL